MTKEIRLVNDDESSEDEEYDYGVKTYISRWVVLTVVCTSTILRGFQQAYAGPVNNVLCHFLNVEPWQIDWLVTTQSVALLALVLPLSISINKIGFRGTTLLMTTSMMVALFLSLVGMWFNKWGYAMLIFAQIFNGFSNTISLSIPPAMSAIWFPKKEVPIAIGFAIAARGLGEALGTFTSPRVIVGTFPPEELHQQIFIMFIILTASSVAVFLANVVFVADHPPTPPSLAQAKSIRKNMSKTDGAGFGKAFDTYKRNISILAKQWSFWVVWVTNASTIPLLRNFTTLLSSALHNDFKHSTGQYTIDLTSGNSLTVAWLVYTVFSFITGPCISRWRKYKEVIIIAVFICFVCNLIALLALAYPNEKVVSAAVIILSASVGVANIAIFEILAEVTYPVPMMFTSVAALYGHGTMRFLYPVINRILLDFVSSWASVLLPTGLTLLSTCLLFSLKKDYKRSKANKEVIETCPLSEKD